MCDLNFRDSKEPHSPTALTQHPPHHTTRATAPILTRVLTLTRPHTVPPAPSRPFPPTPPPATRRPLLTLHIPLTLLTPARRPWLLPPAHIPRTRLAIPTFMPF